jgi:MarR-like DNA-binding transcriptional regulator SgrR of sgrS sRNA
MSCRGRKAVYVYEQRFNRLWGALALMDARKAGEVSAAMISGIIGCSERHAWRLLRRKLFCAGLKGSGNHV